MKTKIFLSCIVLLFLKSALHAQQTMDILMDSIRLNNMDIQANQKYWNARKADYKTGLTINDPTVKYEYLFGSPAGAGNQKDLNISQRFDFPTTYKRKKNLSALQTEQAEIHHQSFRQEILLEAKQIILQLVFLNKKKAVLDQRLKHISQLLKDYQKKFDLGEAIILDLNKAKIQTFSIQNDSKLNQNEIDLLNTRLTALNGGRELTTQDTSYPVFAELPAFEVLDSTILANEPVIKAYEQEKVLLRQQVSVQRALNLPKIETGFHSQGILGQTYRGVFAGISIPLWENKGRINALNASLDHAMKNADAIQLQYQNNNKQLYEQLAVRKNAMIEFRELIGSLRNQELLTKALKLGQITVFQYFQEETFYNNAFDKYLVLELEYQKAIAGLLKYQL